MKVTKLVWFFGCISVSEIKSFEIDLYDFEIAKFKDTKRVKGKSTVQVPYCEPNEKGFMPTFWRGFWPYAGGPNPVSSQQGQGKYKRCLNWNGRPRCSLSSIQDIIKKHPSSKFDLRRPGFTRRTYVNPMITDCSADNMPIRTFKVATSWHRMTWMQRHVLRAWDQTNYCSNVWDFDGDGVAFAEGNWCFLESPENYDDSGATTGDFDAQGAGRRHCHCPPGSDDKANYPEIFDSSTAPNGTVTYTKKTLDNVAEEYKNLYGGQDTCKFLIPGFLPNDTFLITCDAALKWNETNQDRDLTRYPNDRWIMGIPESWFFGRFPDKTIYDTYKKEPKLVKIDDWYYDDGRIDGMYAANIHYPGFPAKKNRHPFKMLKARTRAAPRQLRLVTHPMTAGADVIHPWTRSESRYFVPKHFKLRKNPNQ